MTKKRKVSPDDNRRKKQANVDCDDGRCPASEALRGITVIEAGAKVCVELAPGWGSVLPQKGEDDPCCLIMWDDDNMANTVTNFNAAIATGAVLPAWINAGGAAHHMITIPGLKHAILSHVQITAGGGRVVGNALIAPNDVSQYGQVKTILGYIGFEPFSIQNAQCPIGRHFVLADRRNNTTATADAIAAPPVGLGVAVFA